MGHGIVYGQFNSLSDDLCFRQVDKRTIDPDGEPALRGCFGGKIRHFFKGGNIFRTTVWIAGIVNRRNPDKDILCIQHLCPGKGIRKEDGISRRDVSDGYAGGDLFGRPLFWNRYG